MNTPITDGEALLVAFLSLALMIAMLVYEMVTDDKNDKNNRSDRIKPSIPKGWDSVGRHPGVGRDL